ncbi:MAG: hypoxanthine phosphoribosyltransferase [Bacteroidaceae bacterium]|nr:hypoxanthine phosphoribosyltransferase [Bacteroidaceae bacterium]
MDIIQVKDKKFRISISEEQILAAVKRVASEINRDYEGKNPLLLGVLNGSFMFASDLMKEITVPCNISFVKMASYEGTTTTGKIREIIGINESLEGRHVIIVEDIVDTGYTMKRAVETLGTRNPASVQICTLLSKPANLKVDLDLKYVALDIPNDFMVGYGLDYDGFGRNYRDIYQIVEE